MTLETCSALQFQFEPPDQWRSVIVWRDKKQSIFRPVDPSKRLRDLRPGDEVIYNGERETIHRVEIYR